MVCRAIIKSVENPKGVGEVFNKNRFIARVRYNLDVLQEEPLGNLPETQSRPDILEFTVGKITVIDKGSRIRGVAPLTLYLQDSRKLDFAWQRTDPIQPRYVITSNGNFY